MTKLSKIPLRKIVRVTSVDWSAIPEHEGHRLRALGLDAGVEVEPLHRGMLFWRDPVAVRMGRMTIALRRRHADAVSCEPAG